MNINHIGYVVHDIERYASSMPGLTVIRQVFDPLQHATLALYSCGNGSQIELIQPESKDAFTWGHLQRNGEGPHHVCYDDLDPAKMDEMIARYRMLKIRGPLYAPLFEREVVFAVTQRRAIIEFLL